jgi:hypothetical protein
MRNRGATLFWGRYSRWVGAIFLGLLVALYLLKRFGADPIFSLIGLFLLCVVIVLASIATAVGFYRETRLLGRAHQQEHSQGRQVLQWGVFGVAVVVLVATVIAFAVLASGVVNEIWRAIAR